MVGLKRISTVVGLLAATASAAMGQGTTANPNQTMADSVAAALKSSRALASTRIEIEAQGGLVTLSGVAANADLKNEAISRARSVVGVAGIVDQLQVSDKTVQPAQYVPQQVAMGGHLGHHGFAGGNVVGGGPIGMEGGVVGGPIVDGGMAGGFVGDGGPLPEVRPAARAVERGPFRTPRTTPGPATLRTRTSRRSAIPRPTPGRPGRTSAPSIRTRKSPSTGEPSRFAGTTASGGSTSRSTTPGRSSPPIRSASSPTKRVSATSAGLPQRPPGIIPGGLFFVTSGRSVVKDGRVPRRPIARASRNLRPWPARRGSVG